MATDNIFFIVRCIVCTVEVVRIGVESATFMVRIGLAKAKLRKIMEIASGG